VVRAFICVLATPWICPVVSACNCSELKPPIWSTVSAVIWLSLIDATWSVVSACTCVFDSAASCDGGQVADLRRAQRG
jgi:hypothetical protein